MSTSADSRGRIHLHGGSGGDIPLTVGQLTMGIFWWALWALVCAVAVWCSPAKAQTLALQMNNGGSAGWSGEPQAAGDDLTQAFQQDIQSILQAGQGQVPTGQHRVEVVLGRLDPRLKLAPCDKVQTYLPEGARLWGKTHVGLRCTRGTVPWNVYWPVTVKVWSKAVVAVVPLKPGSIVSAADLRVSEVDLAESTSPAVLDPKEVIGRSVTRMIEPGRSLRVDDIRMRRWFASGDQVKVVVTGEGFSVAAQGIAISHGDEGQCARIRLESQRVLCAQPVGERRAEILL